MSEYRYDPVKRTWVILSTRRGRRPTDYRIQGGLKPEPDNCPFCQGNEAMTPPEVYSLRDPGTEPDSPGWRVRVVPNMYPALDPEAPVQPFTEGVFHRVPGFGVHEVVIETPVINRQMVDMGRMELVEVLQVYRERVGLHLGDERFRTVYLFKNHGEKGGASLIHSHTQIMALPVVPEGTALQLESFIKHSEKTGRCLLCEILEKETVQGARVVEDGEEYAVLAPFASCSPFQLTIVPREHSHDFSLTGDEELRVLARVLGDALRRLRSCLGEHSWNMVLHNAPRDNGAEGHAGAWHWYLEITPRLTQYAGFEMGSGYFINTVAPEECAALLRQCRI